MKYRRILALLVIATISCFHGVLANTTSSKTAVISATPLLQRSDVQQFIQQVTDNYHLNRRYIEHVMATAHLQANVINAMNRPYEAKPWYMYRARFLTQDRIQKGADFWQQHADTLAKAEEIYGVPASVIVAIIGVETYYGKQRGHFSVLDALTTLAFEYPKRSRFFKKELAEFLVLAHDNGINPTTVKGSYAGAIGQPQFMPSSYRHYAVDFAHNGQINLFDNTDDVIGSVANYLRENGWQPKQPIARAVMLSRQHNIHLANKQLKMPYTVSQLRKWGIHTNANLPAGLPVNIVGLRQTKQHDEYWLGFPNFYVITRYNTSSLYAMAVYTLSNAIYQERQQQLVQDNTKSLAKQAS